ncbi:MAG: Gfo/Idh/MocA family oxidoreductase [Planctomycetaceae bacterium]|nr:Gfo/Idh/MocA family oxidoreductase [Planctomycetaceae bacterium]
MMRLGMIGLDTSHVPAFARLLTASDRPSPLDRVQLVAAVAGGSPGFPMSRDRVEGYTAEVAAMGVTIVPNLRDLLECCDGIMIQSVDGRQHLEQAAPVFGAGKPVFIDKPLAASLTDVLAIAELGKSTGVPWFTASSMRYSPGYPELRQDLSIGQIVGCDTFGPSRMMPGHPDLFWYGVHGVDLLYSFLGTGCQQVWAVQTPFTELVMGRWQDGRIGTFRGIREETGCSGWGAAVFGTTGNRHVTNSYDYSALVNQIVHFFLSGRSPVSDAEMVEVFAFLSAAEASRNCDGKPVNLSQVIDGARQGG